MMFRIKFALIILMPLMLAACACGNSYQCGWN